MWQEYHAQWFDRMWTKLAVWISNCKKEFLLRVRSIHSRQLHHWVRYKQFGNNENSIFPTHDNESSVFSHETTPHPTTSSRKKCRYCVRCACLNKKFLIHFPFYFSFSVNIYPLQISCIKSAQRNLSKNHANTTLAAVIINVKYIKIKLFV